MCRYEKTPETVKYSKNHGVKTIDEYNGFMETLAIKTQSIIGQLNDKIYHTGAYEPFKVLDITDSYNQLIIQQLKRVYKIEFYDNDQYYRW